MKRVACILIFLFLRLTTSAQLNYTFAASTGVYSPNVTATALIAANADNVVSTATAIGFSFVFDGVAYTTFRVNENGWLSFNTTSTTNLTNNLAANTQYPLIAPLWDNLKTSSTGGVNYRLTGLSPNRELCVEWLNMLWASTAATPVISFQVKLYETTNRIDFVYRQEAAAVNNSGGGASIGLSGYCAGNYLSLDSANATPVVSASINTNNILIKPATGQLYSWFPQSIGPPCANYLLPLNGALGQCTAGEFLIWDTPPGFCLSGITYDVYLNAGTTATTLVSSQALPYYQTGALLANTQYAWKVVTKNGFGTAIGCLDNTFTTGITFVAQTGTPFIDGFEAPCSEWTYVNGTVSHRNKWFRGAAVNNGGVNAMYISNTYGLSNSYNTALANVTHIYKNITFPAGMSNIALSFDCRAQGESGLDYLKVHVVPTTTTPVAGTALGTGQVGGNINLVPAFTSVQKQLSPAFAGTTQRVVFSWINDASAGTQPPAALDNIQITAIAPIANNECLGAQTLTVGSGSCTPLMTTTFGSTNSTTLPSPTCAGFLTGAANSLDTWYSFVSTSNSLVIELQSGTLNDMGLALYSGSCGALGLIECDDNDGVGNMPSITRGDFIVGNTYYLRTWDNVVLNSGSFSICVFEPSVPANDSCLGATTIVPGVSCVYTAASTVGAQNSTDSPIPTCASYGINSKDVWYAFTATKVSHKIDLQVSSLTDMGMALYSGSCGALNLVECDDDDSPNGLMPFIFRTDFVIGNTYYLRLWDKSNNIGTFQLCLTEEPNPPSNDSCGGAIVITPGVGCTFVSRTTVGASNSTNTPLPTCGLFTAGVSGSMDVWFSFIATSVAHIIDTQTGTLTNLGMALYSGTCGSLSLLECDDDDSNNGLMSAIARNDLVIGQTYYIRVWGYTANSTGTFSLCVSTPAAPVNNECASATILTPGATCVNTSGTLNGSTNSGVSAAACDITAYSNDDIWYKFTALYVTQKVTLNTPTVFDAYMVLYSGLCGSLVRKQCSDANVMLATGLTVGQVYYIQVFAKPMEIPIAGGITICVTNPPTCPTGLGTGVINAGTLVGGYSIVGQTTCGQVNNITNTNTDIPFCGNSSYYTGEDVAYYFTPASSGVSTILLSSTGTFTSMMVYQNCPFVGTCIGNLQSTIGNKSMCLSLTAGVTYYLIIDSYSPPACNAYDLSISEPLSPFPLGTACSNPVVISSLPYSATGETILCFGNDYSNSSAASCGSLYESSEDKVYRYDAIAPSCIGISLTNKTAGIGFQLYQGCPDVAGSICLLNAGSSTTVASGSAILPSGGTYYIVVDGNSISGGSYDLSINDYGASVSNDLPCSAQPLSLGISASGTNSCSGGLSEPAVPSCWSITGTINSVWYSVIAPASGSLKVRTTLGTLSNTQIEVYSGLCTSLLAVPLSCNDNASTCSSSSYHSDVSLVGLTPGGTYFIRVDGYDNLTGTFNIMAIDGAQNFGGVTGQDCITTNVVCAASMTVSNPGYQGIGANCDFPGATYCLTGGEVSSAWYNIPISASGTLEFNIIPNDWPGIPSSSSTDYDFAIWKVGGAVSCGTIAAGTSTPLRCSYSAMGVTGLYGTVAGTAHPGVGSAFNAAYDARISAIAGETYYLVIQNFSLSTIGFSLNFTGTAGINYGTAVVPGSTLTWSGGTNTSWNNASNWSSCNPPVCNINAVINPFTIQPSITAAMGTQSVNNLTINANASLTLGPGAVLKICGNYVNNGTLIADPTSTILFNDDITTHSMSGALSGASKLGNLVITDVTGSTNCSVQTNSDIEIGGSFTTSNATSIFNLNSKNFTIGRNFSNFSGSSTFQNVGTSGTFTFNGSVSQSYSVGAALDLNHVVVNHTGTGITVTGGFPLIVGGNLTLTNGKIIAPNSINQVFVKNNATNAIAGGGIPSFVDGILGRNINSLGSYNFPVGNTAKGYELINIEFTTATLISKLEVQFSNYTILPTPIGAVPIECGINNYNLAPLDNGYWTVTPDVNGGTGVYTARLYNTAGSYTNPATIAWTVMKKSGAGPWLLDGVCAPSTVALVERTGLSGFSEFGVAQAGAVSLIANMNSSTNAFCGTPGSATVAVNGGTAPYTYLWTSGSGTNTTYHGTNSTVSGLQGSPGAGKTYTVIVTDASMSTASATVNITDNQVVFLSYVKNDVTCFGANNGVVNLSVSGGVAPYNYSWNAGFTNASVSGLSIGNYSATVSDSQGCLSSVNIIINEPSQMTINTGGYTSLLCSDSNTDGYISANASGGVAPYAYVWSNLTETNNAVSGLGIGTYTLSVSDINNCVATAIVTINQSTNVVPELLSINHVTCNGVGNGNITVSASGGAPPYKYLWLPGNETTDFLSGLSVGTYSVEVTDNLSCTTIQSFTITEPDLLQAIVTSSNAFCGQNNGTLSTDVVGGTPPYFYQWLDASSAVVGSNQSVSGVPGSKSGSNYQLILSDANGCKAFGAAAIYSGDSLKVELSTTNVTANGGNDGTAQVKVSGGSSPYYFTWAKEETLQSSISGLPAGTYKVYIVDTEGCSTELIYIITQPALQNTMFLSLSKSDVSCKGASDGRIISSISGGIPPYNYFWKPGSAAESFSEINRQRIDTLANLTDLTNFYTLEITDSLGFKVKDSIIVGLISAEVCELHFYNVFSPNGDGENDVWWIDNIEYHGSNTITIFNRIGARVWSGNDYNNTDKVWDGKNESGAELPESVYFYVAEIDGKKYDGWVQLIR